MMRTFKADHTAVVYMRKRKADAGIYRIWSFLQSGASSDGVERYVESGCPETSERLGDLYQQITIIDGSTFDLYLQNMKPLIGAMVRNTEMIIMNRCDEIEDLDVYRRTLKRHEPAGSDRI